MVVCVGKVVVVRTKGVLLKVGLVGALNATITCVRRAIPLRLGASTVSAFPLSLICDIVRRWHGRFRHDDCSDPAIEAELRFLKVQISFRVHGINMSKYESSDEKASTVAVVRV